MPYQQTVKNPKEQRGKKGKREEKSKSEIIKELIEFPARSSGNVKAKRGHLGERDSVK